MIDDNAAVRMVAAYALALAITALILYLMLAADVARLQRLTAPRLIWSAPKERPASGEAGGPRASLEGEGG